MLTKKNSFAAKNGLICEPNLDTLIPNARQAALMLGFSTPPEHCLAEVAPRKKEEGSTNFYPSHKALPKIESFRQKFEW